MIRRLPSLFVCKERSALRVVWWLALLVLVTNDHVLKGSGVFPAWITGKLSDVAGLVVAPVVLARFARAQSSARKVAAMALVAAVFVAMKLSHDVAHGLERLVGMCGMPWRLWVDPTDIVALAVLPLTWRILREVKAEGESNEHHPVATRLEVAVAAAACLATSYDRTSGSLVLVNGTHDTVVVRVYRPQSALDCVATGANPELQVRPEELELERCATLAPLDLLSLDPPEEPGSRGCEAVVLAGDALPATGLFWTDPIVRDFEQGSERNDDFKVYLRAIGEDLTLDQSNRAFVWNLNGALSEADCESLR